MNRYAMTVLVQNQAGAKAFGAEPIDDSRESIILRMIGDNTEMDAFIALMRDYTVPEICGTGMASLEKGGATLRQPINI